MKKSLTSFYKKPKQAADINLNADISEIVPDCRYHGIGLMVVMIDLDNLYKHNAPCQTVMNRWRQHHADKVVLWSIITNENDRATLDQKLKKVFAHDTAYHLHEQLIYHSAGKNGLAQFEITDHLSHRFNDGEVFCCTLCIEKGGAILEKVDLDEDPQCYQAPTAKC